MPTNDLQGDYYKPEPPRKLPSRPPYLTFRAPGNRISGIRGKQIQDEIEKQKKEQEKLRKNQKQLWETCRAELAKLELKRPRELNEVAEGLLRAIDQKSESGTKRKDKLNKRLSVIEEKLQEDHDTLEMRTLSLRQLNQESEVLEQKFDRSKERMTAFQSEQEKIKGGKDILKSSNRNEEASKPGKVAIPRIQYEVKGEPWIQGVEVGEDVKVMRFWDESDDESEENVGNGEESSEEYSDDDDDDEGDDDDEYDEDDTKVHEDEGEEKGQETGENCDDEGGEPKMYVNGSLREGREKKSEEEEKKFDREPEIERARTPTEQQISFQAPSQKDPRPLNNLLEPKEWGPQESRATSPTPRDKRHNGGYNIFMDGKSRNAKSKISKMRKSQEHLQNALEEKKRKAKEIEEEISLIKKKKSALESEKGMLKEQLYKLERESMIKMDGTRTEDEGLDKERKNELDEQYERKQNLDNLREQATKVRQQVTADQQAGHEATGAYIDHVYKAGRLKKMEDTIRRVEELEDVFTRVINSKRESKELQDRVTVLHREKSVEDEMSKSSKQSRGVASNQAGLSHLSKASLKYQPLEQGQIRLLTIWPTPHQHYPLICSLRTRSLATESTSTSKYAALSYFWGPEPPVAYLYVRHDDDRGSHPTEADWGSTARHARRVSIRPNLFRALLRLRKDKDPVTLWVDFLCINQDNAMEKTLQLREMVKIYRMAEEVYVWLGEADDRGRSDRAMDFIETVKDFAMLSIYVEDTERADEWLNISELMRDRWFSRRWVVQEIALAKKATIHCGSKKVHWSDFVDAVSILVSNQANIKKLFNPKAWRDGTDTLGDVQYFGANILIEELGSLFWRAEDGTIIKPIKTLESLVTSLKTFDTSDERDLIYSLIFIASDTFKKTGGYTAELINYKKNTADVYKDFISLCIDGNSNHEYPLDIICRPWAMPAKSGNGGVNPNLPSWIALLSNSAFGEPEQIYKGRKNGETFVGSVGQSKYMASRSKEPSSRFKSENDGKLSQSLYSVKNEDKDATQCNPETTLPTPSELFPWSLVVRGFILATVEKVSPKNTGGLILQESLNMGGWKGIEEMEEEGNVPDKIWRTLVANKDTRSLIPPTWYRRACLRCLEIADNFNGGDLNVGQLLQGRPGMMTTYLTRVQNVVWNRSFFTATVTRRPDYTLPTVGDPKEGHTEEVVPAQAEKPENKTTDDSQGGKSDSKQFNLREIYGDSGKDNAEELKSTELFGLCPGDARSEDLVCIIYGCSVPVILRMVIAGPLQPWYRIVGEAYVHGKMDGEAIDSYDAGWAVGNEQEFHLL
ncbi:hypothetical protein AOL_s00140g93 [Orbilia oligospora ATCC 24927]|uniref:Heterokaryon incompatibility domain-containing protein n=1 Tax=Arthrobotrys oligospora (strain ATCC 24927 / CBS 115.81 / DSM 1491) TaxID=756982 RepID=G1XMC4_ARTOA|nr:hypothetical protein AOL_s00140g93 [Orbilia oligospora ATCC 24927]EGX45777.1 hypothetical protein AOL_s00140g93 [Orbilia oligospora ATCC 24927]